MTSENENKPARRKSKLPPRLHLWLRWLHLYTSMICLMVVLFFSVTGITLNHPEWTFGPLETKSKFNGELRADSIAGDKVDWLKVVEQLRAEHPVHGVAGDMRIDGDEGSLTIKAPGNVADCFFSLETRKYELTINTQGVLGVLNDLHRGRDSGRPWSWLIDLSGVLLVFISATGLAALLYLKKSRIAGLLLALAGIVVVVAMGYLAAK